MDGGRGDAEELWRKSGFFTHWALGDVVAGISVQFHNFLVINIFGISFEVAPRLMSQDPIADKSTLVHVLACCHKGTSIMSVPKELKRAFLTPLIKKIILDAEILKNYRPVSNLLFLSKLIERIVCVQLVNHLDKNGLYEVFQSAYRQLHSTETASLRVQNDILQAVDSRGGAILVLLDLSAAFDTIDHEKLIRTLDIYIVA